MPRFLAEILNLHASPADLGHMCMEIKHLKQGCSRGRVRSEEGEESPLPPQKFSGSNPQSKFIK